MEDLVLPRGFGRIGAILKDFGIVEPFHGGLRKGRFPFPRMD